MANRLWGVALLCAPAVFAGSALAASDVNVGDRIRFFDREGNTGGGEFGVAIHPATSVELFRTFCVQAAEYMDFHVDGFDVVSINDFTILGNKPLKAETAFLYQAFRNGTLPDYGGGNHVDDANALQRAIWYFQGESGGSNNNYAKYASDAVTAGAGLLGAHPWASTDEWVGMGIGNVRIMNLVWATTRNGRTAGTHAQDQLIIIPLPPAVLAGGVLLAVAAVPTIRRRMAARAE